MVSEHPSSGWPKPEIGKTYKWSKPHQAFKATAWPMSCLISTNPPTFSFELENDIGIASFRRGKYLGEEGEDHYVFEGRTMFKEVLTLCLFRVKDSPNGIIGRKVT